MSSFITLSYSDENLPVVDGVPNLVKMHLQQWLKRIRRASEPLRLRFYAVGEYGDASERPHYHVILFGYPECSRGRTKRGFNSTRADAVGCCDNCRRIFDTWTFGDVDCGAVTRHSAGYVAGYCVKKMTAPDDHRLRGRCPEFARMSLRPGIGADALWDVASTLMQYDLDETQMDVPDHLRVGPSGKPLGRYLRRKLRSMIGREVDTPDEVLQAMAEDLRPLREAAFYASKSFAQAVVDAAEGERRNFYARQAIFKGRKSL